MAKAAYIHIPFCDTICSYCDFCKVFYNKEQVSKYLLALNNEIKERYNGEKIKTIYIGGGTPSCLNTQELLKLFDIIRQLNCCELTEFTIECNIESIDEEKLKLFKQAGINRLSIGVQSFNEQYLALLNRHHTKDEAINKILMAKKYFNNINIDLIYAIPGQSIMDLEKDLDVVLSLDIDHISTYSLIIEDHTVLKNNKVIPIDEDLDAMMYQLIKTRLKDYNHYEISNFSKKPCLHNLTYWHSDEYYGFGAGACGYLNGYRYENTRSIPKYISGHYLNDKYYLTEKEKIEEYFMLGLRLVNGVSKSTFKTRFKKEIKDIKQVKKLLNEEKLIEHDDYLYINPQYLYTSNDILIELIDL